MAWPPATLPTNRTNATPQQDTHPADHNALAQAINDTVPMVQALLAGQVVQGVLAVGSPLIPAGTLGTVSFTTVSTPSWGGGPTFVAPAGTTGWFLLGINVQGPGIPMANTSSDVIINVVGGSGSASYPGYVPPGKSNVSVVAFSSLGAMDQVGFQIFNSTGGDAFYTCHANIVRVSPP